MKRKLLALFCISIFQLSAQNALNFDGVDDHITSSFTGISGTSARTVEAWIRTTVDANPSASGQKVIVDWGSASPLAPGLH